MRNRLLTQVVVAVVCGVLAGPAVAPMTAGPASMGRVVASAPATLNGVAIPRETTMFSGDRLTTGAQGWARLYLGEGEQVHLAALTEARAARAGERVDVELMNGRVLVQTRAGSSLNVQANGLAIQPTGKDAVWEVTRASATEVLVAARSGSVEIHGANRSLSVPAGRSARVTTSADAPPAPPVKTGGLTSGQKGAIIAGIVGGVIATAVIVHNQSESNRTSPVASPSGL